uniref:Phytochrome B n=1 Tax=Rhizophora mucronata TaxID=61149 RepID=A0A2P2NG35_RHIMU
MLHQLVLFRTKGLHSLCAWLGQLFVHLMIAMLNIWLIWVPLLHWSWQ